MRGSETGQDNGIYDLEVFFRRQLSDGISRKELIKLSVDAGWEKKVVIELLDEIPGGKEKRRNFIFFIFLMFILFGFTWFYFSASPTGSPALDILGGGVIQPSSSPTAAVTAPVDVVGGGTVEDADEVATAGESVVRSGGGSGGSGSSYVGGSGSFNPFGGGSGGSSSTSSASSSTSSSSDTTFYSQAFVCDIGDISTTCWINANRAIVEADRETTFNNLIITKDATISLTGIMNISWTITGNATINGSFNFQAAGFQGGPASTAGDGPGGGAASGGGAGHGGSGADGASNTGGTFYDDALAPVQAGSGGGSRPNTALGGDGGGALKLNVNENLTFTGTINVRGTNGETYSFQHTGGGGGSGGSVWLIAKEFNGNGSILAQGGNGGWQTNPGGGGAGGRVMVEYETIRYNGTINITGGLTYSTYADAEDGTAIIYNKLRNLYTLSINQSLSSVNFTVANLYIPPGVFVVLTDDLTNSTIRVNNATINGTLSTNSRGFPGGTSSNAGEGPGGGGISGGGAGYGGAGRNGAAGAGGAFYDSMLFPSFPGSGGGGFTATGGSGGGLLNIFVNNTFRLAGNVESDGGNGGTYSAQHRGSGGGSGGGIFINTTYFLGNGNITAEGGNGGVLSNYGGGGAGGRISVHFNWSYFEGILDASPGLANNLYPAESGSPILYNKIRGMMTITSNSTISEHQLEPTGFEILDAATVLISEDLGNFTLFASENITINGTLDATGTGYTSNAGPGGATSNAGGGHGGAGSAGHSGGTGAENDDSLLPVFMGSGGGTASQALGGYGGGLIWLISEDTLTVNGEIISNGNNGRIDSHCCGGYASGAGSGGTIFLNATILNGTGVVNSSGGIGGSYSSKHGGGGGGGRIALEFLNYQFSGLVEASGKGITGYVGEDGSVVNRTRMLAASDAGTSALNLNFSKEGQLNPDSDIFGFNNSVLFWSQSAGRRAILDVFASGGAGLDLSTLVIDYSSKATAVNIDSLGNNVGSTISLFVPNNNNEDGVFVCPNSHSVANTVSDCSGVVEFAGPFPQQQNVGGDTVTVSIVGGDYFIEGLTGTGVGAIDNLKLKIWDSTDDPFFNTVTVNNNSFFYANWTNTSTGVSVDGTGKFCDIFIDYGSVINFTMLFNATNELYYYNLTIPTVGIHDWNVTCNDSTEDISLITVNDTFNVTTSFEVAGGGDIVTEFVTGSVIAANVSFAPWGKFNDTGGSPAVLAQAQNVTMVNMSLNISTNRWQGYFGEVFSRLVIGVDFDIFFDFSDGISGSSADAVYASANSEFDFSNMVNVSDATVIDGAYSFDSNSTDSVNNTYRTTEDFLNVQSKSVLFPGLNFTNSVFSDNTTSSSLSGSPLNYSWGSLVRSDNHDWNTTTSDYQLLVPVNQSMIGDLTPRTTTYYFFLEIN